MPAERQRKSARRGVSRPLPVIKGQGDLLTEWREVGLITDYQFETFTRTAKPTSKVH
ncbi:hypothetical protein [Streptomyces californicus]